ncbi:MAG TPA: polyprenyl synthetase family protein [Caulobacteraceae bacterium]|nr:polyprenyl synthetase family protein [Caulobacteraceae bacterium]
MDDNAVFLQSVEALRAGIDRRLAELIPAPTNEPLSLNGATHYALLAPGKRFRPLLTLLCAEAFGAPPGRALDVACAMEMVHAASLILDDLPSMDDARLRRGRPTTHRAWGEAQAILAAVGLLNQAFAAIAAAEGLSPAAKVQIIGSLTDAVGFNGLVAGQALDLQDRDRTRSSEEIEALNHQKTGVLMIAAAEAGAHIGGASAQSRAEIGEFARRVGLAFQIRDDLIDAEESPEFAGKDVGKDVAMTTWVSAVGARSAAAAMQAHLDEAEAALVRAGCDGRLGRFARSLFKGRKAAA